VARSLGSLIGSCVGIVTMGIADTGAVARRGIDGPRATSAWVDIALVVRVSIGVVLSLLRVIVG
jgi:hypothetical protein